MKPLRPQQDAYGHALWDAWRGQASCAIIERADGYIDTDAPAASYLAPCRAWSGPERAALRWARGRVLDIGCGAGRVGLELQQRGCQVVGIDNSPLAVKLCRERGLKQVRVLALAELDAALGRFDTVVMYGNNFGLFGSAAGTRRYLRRLGRLTHPGARLLAATNDPYQTTNPDHLAFHRWNRRRGRLAGQLRFRIRYRRWCGPWMDYLMVSREELQQLARGAGWRVERFCNWSGTTYVAVLTKKEHP